MQEALQLSGAVEIRLLQSLKLDDAKIGQGNVKSQPQAQMSVAQVRLCSYLPYF